MEAVQRDAMQQPAGMNEEGGGQGLTREVAAQQKVTQGKGEATRGDGITSRQMTGKCEKKHQQTISGVALIR